MSRLTRILDTGRKYQATPIDKCRVSTTNDADIFLTAATNMLLHRPLQQNRSSLDRIPARPAQSAHFTFHVVDLDGSKAALIFCRGKSSNPHILNEDQKDFFTIRARATTIDFACTFNTSPHIVDGRTKSLNSKNWADIRCNKPSVVFHFHISESSSRPKLCTVRPINKLFQPPVKKRTMSFSQLRALAYLPLILFMVKAHMQATQILLFRSGFGDTG